MYTISLLPCTTVVCSYNFLNKKAEALRRAQSLGEALEHGEDSSFMSTDEDMDEDTDESGSSQENAGSASEVVCVSASNGGGSDTRVAAGTSWIDLGSKSPGVVANHPVKTRQSEDSILAANEVALEIPQSVLDAP